MGKSLTISKEAVLKAANENDCAKKVLETLFPNVFEELDYKERQAEWIKKNKVTRGTLVKILRIDFVLDSSDLENGLRVIKGERWGWGDINNERKNAVGWRFDSGSVKEMSEMVGKTYKIKKIEDDCIWINGCPWPYFKLEVVKEEYAKFGKEN